jgi:hypothetical protein
MTDSAEKLLVTARLAETPGGAEHLKRVAEMLKDKDQKDIAEVILNGRVPQPSIAAFFKLLDDPKRKDAAQAVVDMLRQDNGKAFAASRLLITGLWQIKLADWGYRCADARTVQQLRACGSDEKHELGRLMRQAVQPL